MLRRLEVWGIRHCSTMSLPPSRTAKVLPNFKVVLEQALGVLLPVSLGTHRRIVVVLRMVVPVMQAEVVMTVVLVVLVKVLKMQEFEKARVEQFACHGQMMREDRCG